MPGAVLNKSSTIKCSLMGTVTASTGAPKVLIMGQPALIQTDTYTIPDCPGGPGSTPPCKTGTWQTAATKVLVGGAPILVADSTGMGQPTPHKFTVAMVQEKVLAN